jgi:hypothetical protein
MADNHSPEHDDLMKRHRERREVNWTPYHERRSSGALKFTDEGARVKVEIAIAGLGTLVILADSVYSEQTQTYRWNSEAILSASIE